MNASRSRLIHLAVVCAALVTTSAASRPAGPALAAAAASFAVVELFTSQGCSSCPPADALLADLASQARSKGLPIYCLAFHVDYWDQLGWKDPFSAAVYSARQKEYARAMHSQRIYTPQMIVNGTEEFVGSDRERAEQTIDEALEHAGSVTVTIRAVADGPPQSDASRGDVPVAARVSYTLKGAPRDAVLHLAAVERGLVSPVARGENAGRVLHDDNVVRAYVTVAAAGDSDGTVTVPLPRGTVPRRTSIVAYVQRLATMAVLGGTAIDFP